MNRTLHYGLPLFEAADKPSILVDWNETMQDLDDALFTLATGGDSSVADAITALQQAVASINSQITTINQTLGNTLDTTFMNNIAPQFEATGVEYNPKDMVFHNGNLYICFTQYADNQDDEDHFDQYFIPVWLANKVTDNLKDVDSLKTRMTSAESGLLGLDTRVTALENAPAPSGGVTLQDLNSGNEYHTYSNAVSGSANGFTGNNCFLGDYFSGDGYFIVQPNVGFEFNSLPEAAKNKTIRTIFSLIVSDTRGGSYVIDRTLYLQQSSTYFCKGTQYSANLSCPVKIDPVHTNVKVNVDCAYFDETSERDWISFNTSSASIYNNSIYVEKCNS